MSVLKVHIPPICIPEIEYTFRCFFEHFIPVDFEFVKAKDKTHYCIQSESGSISIKNHFFHFDNPVELYCKENIPNKVDSSSIKIDNDIYSVVGLFGNNKLKTIDQNYHLDLDFIASSFFMLSRWEESLEKEPLDKHERFPYESSLAYKFDFYHRPIVNEYVALLTALLAKIGIKSEKKYQYQAVITYDIDHIAKWKKPKVLFESIRDNIFKRNFPEVITDMGSYFNTVLFGANDPHFSFQFIVDSLKNRRVEAITYFKTSISNPKFDQNLYDLNSNRLQNILSLLKKANVKLGLHPSYNTFNDKVQFKKEVNLFRSATDKTKKLLVRQHYLRFGVPTTWAIMQDVNVSSDSTLIYAEKAGFRSGVCYSFPVFDVRERKMLSLIESPVLFMETPLINDPSTIPIKVKAITNMVKKYNGTNVILWHNNNLYYKKHREAYLQVLDIIEA